MGKRRHLESGRIAMSSILKVYKFLSKGESISEVSRRLGIARSTVRDYKIKADGCEYSYRELSELSESEIKTKIILHKSGRRMKVDPNMDLEYLSKELLKKGVTRLLLFTEYYSKDPENSVSYSTFCYRLAEHSRSSKLSMKKVYKPGREYFVDFSGLTVPVYGVSGTVNFQAQIFVSTLGLSNYTYVEAVASQKLEDFIGATVRSISFLKGVPQCLVPDNLKAAVTKASKYEPDINKTYRELGNYYGTSVLPARVRKPQDKAKVETSVKLIQQRILAPLRDRRFYTIAELNSEIKPLLEAFNNRTMKSYGCSRYQLYREVERAELLPLPSVAYEQCVWKKAKVAPDYHVLVEHCHYSVPYHHRAIIVDVCIRENTIEIYNQTQQIALHKRVRPHQIEDLEKRLQHCYSTHQEHMPDAHRFVSRWSKAALLAFTQQVGQELEQFVKVVLQQQQEPIALKAALVLPSLKDKYGKDLLEMTAALLNRKGIHSIKYFRETVISLAGNGNNPPSKPKLKPIDEHENIRGGDYYH